MDRTSCSCRDCVQCCKEQPGSLIPGDMERIAAHLGKPLEEVKPLFWASPGALVGDTRTGRTWRVGTITPRFDTQKRRCVFLDDADRCTIHAVAPFGCSHFDTHMGRNVALKRGQHAVRRQMAPDYQILRDTLDAATTYKPRLYLRER